MSREPQKIGLDNPVFQGRLRAPLSRRAAEVAIARRPHARNSVEVHGIAPAQQSSPRTLEKTVESPKSDSRQATVNHIAALAVKGGAQKKSNHDFLSRIKHMQLPRIQPKFVLQTMAVVVFIIGLSVSLRTEQTNRQATAKVDALSQQADNGQDDAGTGDVPSTKKPPKSAIQNYAVAPDLPRHIIIPKLGINARVLQIGVKTNGALDTPRNVYDTGWYTGSAKPGQPGATVIDGHVSSWKTKGIFYGLKNLRTGDKVTVTKGDGTLVSYRVVQQKTYKAEAVDMQKVITPITTGKSGLNLITCAGKSKPGTNDFTHRTVIFAEQI